MSRRSSDVIVMFRQSHFASNSKKPVIISYMFVEKINIPQKGKRFKVKWNTVVNILIYHPQKAFFE